MRPTSRRIPRCKDLVRRNVGTDQDFTRLTQPHGAPPIAGAGRLIGPGFRPHPPRHLSVGVHTPGTVRAPREHVLYRRQGHTHPQHDRPGHHPAVALTPKGKPPKGQSCSPAVVDDEREAFEREPFWAIALGGDRRRIGRLERMLTPAANDAFGLEAKPRPGVDLALGETPSAGR